MHTAKFKNEKAHLLRTQTRIHIHSRWHIAYTQRECRVWGSHGKGNKIRRQRLHVYTIFTQAANTFPSIHRRAHSNTKIHSIYLCNGSNRVVFLSLSLITRHIHTHTQAFGHSHSVKRIKCAPAKIIAKHDSNVCAQRLHSNFLVRAALLFLE